MTSERQIEVNVRRWLIQQLKDARARLGEIDKEIAMRELRLEVEADLLDHNERNALEEQIEGLRSERQSAEKLVTTLPERIELYRPMGRPEPTISVSRN